MDWLDKLFGESGQGGLRLGGRVSPDQIAGNSGVLKKRLPPSETTKLDPLQEALFLRWIDHNKDAPGIRGWEEPDTFYDIRGFWNDKEALGQWKPGDHGPDIYKQHGHPTFSVESKYSRGLQDGGQWIPNSPDERGLIGPLMAAHKKVK